MRRSRFFWLAFAAILLGGILLALSIGDRLRRQAELPAPEIPCAGEPADCALALSTFRTIAPNAKQYVRSINFHYDTTNANQLSGFTSTYGDMWIDGTAEQNAKRATIIHEYGHILDFRALTGNPRGKSTAFTFRTLPTFRDDPSYTFYTISWTDSTRMKPDAKTRDFVTDYAMTNPIEDFAESFAYYLLAHDAFEERAKKSKALQLKYDFIKTIAPKDTTVATGDKWDGTLPASTTDLVYTWLDEK